MKGISCFATVLLTLVSASCSGDSGRRGYEYMPDMAHSAAYRSFSPNPAMRNGATIQQPVPGSIPRGYTPFRYGSSEEEAARAGRELRNPLTPTPAVLSEGKALYATFCVVCHGENGAGDGPLVPKIPNPPSFTSKRLLEMPAGRLFHVMTRGSGRMPSYSSQITTRERWRIVTYVQSLQQTPGYRR